MHKCRIETLPAVRNDVRRRVDGLVLHYGKNKQFCMLSFTVPLSIGNEMLRTDSVAMEMFLKTLCEGNFPGDGDGSSQHMCGVS